MNKLTKPIYIIGLSTYTSSNDAQQEIGKLWASFFKAAIKDSLKNIVSDSIFSVYSDYKNKDRHCYKVTIGYAVDNLNEAPSGLSFITIPAGSYQVYKPKSKSPHDIVATWEKIWAADIKILPRNFIVDFEEYEEEGVLINIGCN